MGIFGNRLIFAGGTAAPAWGDPGIWWDEVVTRAKGVMLLGDFNITDVTASMQFGFDTNQSGAIDAGRAYITAENLYGHVGGGSNVALYTVTDATEYRILVALSTAGAHCFIKELP